MSEALSEENFLVFAAKYYDNPCHDTQEFLDDLKRFKYIKRLFVKYHDTGDLRERLILNHIIILYNVFNDAATDMLFLRLKGYYEYLKPFLVLLNRLPDEIQFTDAILYTSEINMDATIVSKLRTI